MWVSDKVISLFSIAKDTVDAQRAEVTALRVERDALKLQLATSQNHFDWLRVRVNTLEIERAQLIEKAYGLKVPVPEIVRQSKSPIDFNTDLFTDMGDDAAKQMGLPVYGN